MLGLFVLKILGQTLRIWYYLYMTTIESTINTKLPHGFTLELLRLAIVNLPPMFSEQRRVYFEQQHSGFMKNAETPYSDIHSVIVSLGKESWALRKAYEEMYSRYGRSSEEAHLFQNLDEGIRAKYETFLHEGGKISHIESAKSGDDVWKASPFETYFNPEEKFAIEQALLVARESASEEIDELVMGPKKDEFDLLTKENRVKESEIEVMIDDLRSMASVSKKWEGEILGRVQTLEEGWSVVEQGLTVENLEREKEYWTGTLESFLQ